MTRFDDLVFRHKKFGQLQALVVFKNGYTASIMPMFATLSGKSGTQWEVAVLKDGNLDYSTPVTDDTVRWLEYHQVDDVLKQIEELPEQDQ